MDKAKPSTEEKATPQPQAPAPEKDETKNPQATQK